MHHWFAADLRDVDCWMVSGQIRKTTNQGEQHAFVVAGRGGAARFLRRPDG
jgi:hypothetical protein